MTASTSKPVSCDGCQKQFPSKNKLFQHLALNSDGCLSPDEYAEYLRNPRHFEKICVLYGYLPGTDYHQHQIPDGACGVEGGQHAAWLLTQAIDRVCRGISNADGTCFDVTWSDEKATNFKPNRSYGSVSRNTNAALQDEHTGAVTEMLCTTTSPLFFNFTNDDITKEEEEEHKKRVTVWVQKVNHEIDHLLSSFNQKTTTKQWSPGSIRVFGRLSMPQKKFNPETDVVHRRVDYCFPADLLYVSKENDGNMTISDSAVQLQDVQTIQEFMDKMVSFPPGNKPARAFATNKADRRREDDYQKAPISQDRDRFRPTIRPDEETLTYLFSMKKVMQAFTTQVEDMNENDPGALLDKRFSDTKRRKQKQHNSAKQQKTAEKEPQKKKHRKQTQLSKMHSKEDNVKTMKEADSSNNLPSKRYLRRKRFHNFSPHVLAHDFLAYRRLDRIYHRGTIRLDAANDDCSSNNVQTDSRPFAVFSLTGDIFLYQQARRIVGLLIAILRGCIDVDILDCIFDENYAHLVPAPLAPSVGLLQGEATYMTYEGRLATVLSARRTNAFSKGFNDEDIVSSVEKWEESVLKNVAKSWYAEGIGVNGQLNFGTEWLETVLHPWAQNARKELDTYRRWKAGELTSSLPPLTSINTRVPEMYAKCLHLLREADANGAWPDTTAQRQLVMMSTPNDDSQSMNLTAARMATKINNSESRSCAYSFKEGEGGASGSFSVGIMPDRSSQPKGNTQFPQLVKAAFELEIALFPNREPSSTIAINRNAQFRPHKDKGAGAGQSTSLIVAMGNFVGGELMVEGDKKDIRYNPIEFNGWKQRHWTLPFKGERFSLVWFTPKGCEGMRGIDIDYDSLVKGEKK